MVETDITKSELKNRGFKISESKDKAVTNFYLADRRVGVYLRIQNPKGTDVYYVTINDNTIDLTNMGQVNFLIQLTKVGIRPIKKLK